MTDLRRTSGLALALLLALAACTSGVSTAPTPAPTPVPTEPTPAATAPASAPGASPAASSTASPEPAGSGATPSPAAVTLTQAWATAPLRDARTGTEFRLADLAGKVVFLEPMAIWCTKCRSQQLDAVEALSKLDRSRVVYVSLDVDPSEDGASLASYAERYGFDWTYAVATREMARELAADFGDRVLDPPSTPIIVIAADGQATLTDFGHKSVEELVSLARRGGA